MHLTRRLALLLLTGLMPLLALAQGAKDYVIGPGDQLRITVYQNPDLSQEVRVSESGSFSYPLLGQLKLGGLSITQAEKAITEGLRNGNFVKQPQVSVLVTQVRGNQVSVLGMVGKPGRYPIEVAGMRLSELIAMAGGIAGGGSDSIQFSGIRNGKPVSFSVDIGKLTSAATTDQNPVVQDGDVIYVDRMPMIYIYGEVQKPGSYRLERNLSIMQALAIGGGTTARGTIKGMRLHRRGADGKVNESEPAMNDLLQDGDVLYIKQSLF